MHSKIRQSSLLSALDTSSAIKHLSRFLVFFFARVSFTSTWKHGNDEKLIC